MFIKTYLNFLLSSLSFGWLPKLASNMGNDKSVEAEIKIHKDIYIYIYIHTFLLAMQYEMVHKIEKIWKLLIVYVF
jgi:hypothetical protein